VPPALRAKRAACPSLPSAATIVALPRRLGPIDVAKSRALTLGSGTEAVTKFAYRSIAMMMLA
jgi:hypothetical protein